MRLTKKNQETEVKKSKSPFKEQDLLEKEITDFINKFKATVVSQSKRISDYFEMCCFNYIVRYYELNKYQVSIRNTSGNIYKYKCSPAALHSNFSYFEVAKVDKGELYEFEIHHNLALQSSHSENLFTVSDISVIKKDTIKMSTNYYDNKRRLSYSLNENLITFCEVKHMNPFPELIFNFIGIVNELRAEIIFNTSRSYKPQHIAPSLMISGKPSKPTKNIKLELENRYCINIIFDLFYSGIKSFSKGQIEQLQETGSITKTRGPSGDFEPIIIIDDLDDKDLPF